MDTLEAILTRRSVAKMSDRRPGREDIEVLLRAAVRAPNHHLTEPWRFIVITGGALDELGEAMAERVRQQYAGLPELAGKVELEKSRPHRAPVILVLIYVPSTHPKAIEREDRYAVGAAIENILLAAHSRAMAGYLRTGPAAEFAGVHRYLGLNPGEEVAGFIYLGYPADQPNPVQSRRTDPMDRAEWRGWDS